MYILSIDRDNPIYLSEKTLSHGCNVVRSHLIILFSSVNLNLDHAKFDLIQNQLENSNMPKNHMNFVATYFVFSCCSFQAYDASS